MQFHGGVYRSDDAGESWTDIGTDRGLPSDFGFPLAIDPNDPDRAFVIPLAADADRVTPDGRVRVYETRDRGATWQALRRACRNRRLTSPCCDRRSAPTAASRSASTSARVGRGVRIGRRRPHLVHDGSAPPAGRIGTLRVRRIMPAQHILDFYTRPAAMTSLGGHARLFAGLPRETAELARIVQGLILHEHFAPAYGVALSDERRAESHIRTVERMLDACSPVTVGRSSAACPHRQAHHRRLPPFHRAARGGAARQGIPARARCGFGAYFDPASSSTIGSANTGTPSRSAG